MPVSTVDAARRLYALIEEIDACLAGLEPRCPEIGWCRDGLASLKLTPASFALITIEPVASPECLGAALALARTQGSARLTDAIERARACLPWSTYQYPGHSIGPRFSRAHAFVELIGPGMPFPAPDFSLGLFLIGPRTFYRDHRHPAPELYVPLTGPTQWRFERKAWVRRDARHPIWNEAGRVHATLVEEAPFLCIYVWTRDVTAPASVVAAPDWDEIEQRL
jgi:hypothetical protein